MSAALHQRKLATMLAIALVVISGPSITTANAAVTKPVVKGAIAANLLTISGSGFPANAQVKVTLTSARTTQLFSKTSSDGRFLSKVKLTGTLQTTLSISASVGKSVATTSVKPSTITTQSASSCVAPANAQIKDWDKSDPIDPPWPHVVGHKTVVQFEIAKLSARNANFVKAAVKAWSVGPCITAVAVTTCAAKSNCVTMSESAKDPGDGTDGDTVDDYNGKVRTDCSITLYTSAMAGESEKQALVTVTHEMGHALGLSHRNSDKDLMYSSSDDSISTQPDSIDMYNLLVMYGK